MVPYRSYIMLPNEEDISCHLKPFLKKQMQMMHAKILENPKRLLQ